MIKYTSLFILFALAYWLLWIASCYAFGETGLSGGWISFFAVPVFTMIALRRAGQINKIIFVLWIATIWLLFLVCSGFLFTEILAELLYSETDRNRIRAGSLFMGLLLYVSGFLTLLVLVVALIVWAWRRFETKV